MSAIKGPGKYDEHAERVIKETNAGMVLLVVISGDKGSGFSVSCVEPFYKRFGRNIPTVLREVANDIEKLYEKEDQDKQKDGGN